MRDNRAFLEDILEAIGRIEKYAARGRASFDADELVQTWMVHHLQIIGEAVGKLDDGFKAKHPEVPWAVIKAMRNVLVHFYFGVNLDMVWKTVIEDVPALKGQVTSILAGLGPTTLPEDPIQPPDQKPERE